jgi:sugar transferase (PEP-CTERM/EpsH1 system associated)
MKIFYLTPRVPFPIDKGDKLRAFYQIKYLSARHEVFLFALDENLSYDPDADPLKKMCAGVRVIPLTKFNILVNLLRGIFRKIPLQTCYYYSDSVKRKIDEAIEEFKPDIIYSQLVRSAEFVRDIKSIPKVIDYVDVISKGLERRIEKSGFLWKLALRLEYGRARKYERRVFQSFNASIIITKEDRGFLPFEEREAVHIIPNGVDTSFFSPQEYTREYDLFFSGNLSYHPNIDAAKYLVYRILPMLRKKHSDVKVLIAGASPNREMMKISSENVVVKGWVDDIREYYRKAKIFIAPMQMGTGLQNKLLQAMAMKVPCLISELAMKGLCNTEEIPVLIAHTPEEYAGYIVKLLDDKEYAETMGRKGYEYVRANYDWGKIITDLESILFSVIRK